MTTYLVTGGAGFIGSALVRHLLLDPDVQVVNVDKLTYAGNLASLEDAASNPRYHFERTDIADGVALRAIFTRYRPDFVMHLAAESHVDRSIAGPAPFIMTNLVGTYTLLECAREHWQQLPPRQRSAFRLVHLSTDEVFGALGEEGAFDEQSPYRPSSPYSASKAGADHLAAAWHTTWGLPVIVSGSTNNYGPHQHGEKLIPRMIAAALQRQPLPVYGDGRNVRDWIHVDDHVRALCRIAVAGVPGQKYLVGARAERRNIDVVRAICVLLDELLPDRGGPREELIEFVADRPGHDWRYAVDPARVERELGWRATIPFEEGLRTTVRWYMEHGA